MHTIYNFLIILLTTCDVANLIIIVNSYLILVVDKKFSEWFFVNSRAQVSVLPMSINSFRQVQAYFGVIHNLTHVHSNIMNGLSFFSNFFAIFLSLELHLMEFTSLPIETSTAFALHFTPL